MERDFGHDDSLRLDPEIELNCAHLKRPMYPTKECDRMFRKTLLKLEDQKHPLFGPTVKVLRLTGLWKSDDAGPLHWVYFLTVGIIIFVSSQYLELWFIRNDLENALQNLSITMLSTISIIKASTFIIWEKDWKDVITSMSEREVSDIRDQNPIALKIMADYIKYSRSVSYVYWFLVIGTGVALIFTPLFKIVLSSSDYGELLRNGTEPYPLIMSSYFPFDTRVTYAYFMIYLIQSFMIFYGGLVVGCYDANSVAVMILFAGQLKIIKEMCVEIFDNGDVIFTDEEALQKLRLMHERHTFLVKYSYIFNSVLSPVLFSYVFTVSLMICASAVRISMDGTTTVQQLWIMEYVLALVLQLFGYCLHGHAVLTTSEEISTGVYESQWWNRSVRLRKHVLLLHGKLGKQFRFNAGPFTLLNLNTFVAIMKGSYSYYALLRTRNS